jgi:hypothetical protein
MSGERRSGLEVITGHCRAMSARPSRLASTVSSTEGDEIVEPSREAAPIVVQ